MARRDAILIGIQGTVLALDPTTGDERWRTELKGTSFVNVTLHGRTIVAATRGELFGLDASTGTIVWRNKLKGLGTGFITIAGAGQVPAMALQTHDDGGAAAAAAAAASG